MAFTTADVRIKTCSLGFLAIGIHLDLLFQEWKWAPQAGC